jgi:hypothetical protein
VCGIFIGDDALLGGFDFKRVGRCGKVRGGFVGREDAAI